MPSQLESSLQTWPVPGSNRVLQQRKRAVRGRSGLGPYQLLGAALDHLVAVGVLPIERRTHAEYVAWSAVHGLAMLVMNGPLHAMAPRQIEQLTQRVLDMVDRGI